MIYYTTYLGSVGYYRHWLNDTDALIEQWETYPKQTERNRCAILGANGIQQLTIPVERSHGEKIYTRDIRITYQQKWQHQHCQAIRSAYQHSAFYDYYADFFLPFYTKEYRFLLDFNAQLMDVVLQLLEKDKNIMFTTNYIGINFADSETYQKPYYQVFQDKFSFQKDLSIIDLLFNEGPEAYKWLKE